MNVKRFRGKVGEESTALIFAIRIRDKTDDELGTLHFSFRKYTAPRRGRHDSESRRGEGTVRGKLGNLSEIKT